MARRVGYFPCDGLTTGCFVAVFAAVQGLGMLGDGSLIDREFFAVGELGGLPEDAGETVEGGIGGMQEGVFPEVGGGEGMALAAQGGLQNALAVAVEVDAEVKLVRLDAEAELVVSVHVVEGGDMEVFGALALPGVGRGGV